MDQLLAANKNVYAAAMAARDNAQSLSDQASVARDERDRLQRDAEQKMVAAQNAAIAAQAALDAQTEHLDTLQAQLAALKEEHGAQLALARKQFDQQQERSQQLCNAYEEREAASAARLIEVEGHLAYAQRELSIQTAAQDNQ